jgi:ABC-type glutathione transport system ATPase component
VNELIHRLRDDGATVICVSHDMPLLAEVVDRVLVMWNAQLIADASPREVFANADVMRQTKLQPPQIATISLRLKGRNARPAALTVGELAHELAGSHPSGGG